ncbi:hypothetical protein [Paenibacillus humicus]|uniref:hypothetical protein n=1 Tax=Paenibacillus humicus TaxID=412861 RepID=UPI003F1622D4
MNHHKLHTTFAPAFFSRTATDPSANSATRFSFHAAVMGLSSDSGWFESAFVRTTLFIITLPARICEAVLCVRSWLAEPLGFTTASNAMEITLKLPGNCDAEQLPPLIQQSPFVTDVEFQ